MTSSNESALVFLDEEMAAATLPAAVPWRILIVDDDEDVHETTQYALQNMLALNRPLAFLHAHSAGEALSLLRQEHDIAVVLLDVVMETEDAGLRLIDDIRNQLGLANLRIILRTGQPGYAPEVETIRRYDINDYKTKNDLTRSKLYATVTTAIRAYDQLQRIDAARAALDRIVRASNQLLGQQGLADFSAGVIAQIASLVGIPPEGLVCVQGSENDPGEFIIFAAAGRFGPLIGKRLSDLPDPRIAQTLAESIGQRKNIVAESHVCLFISGSKSRFFAAYVASEQPMRQVDEQILNVFCTHIALCADNVGMVQKLRDLAFRDPLTGLPNRNAFIQQVDQMLEEGKCDGTILALVDIDQFAETLDILGHQYGDLLLREVARRLTAALGTECFIARVAGDTYGLIGPEAVLQGNALQALFSTPLLIQELSQIVTVSIGSVLIDNEREAAVELLKNAALALKRAKSGGIGQSVRYSRQIGAETRERMRMLHGLRAAFDYKNLYLVYQPQISLTTGAVIGLEALMRWRGEDGKNVPPDRFIPIAEQSGLIVPLGDWALRSALLALNWLNDAGHTGLRMAVNVSAVQFRQPDFLASVDNALRETKAAAEFLELEITESVAILGLAVVQNIIHALKTRRISVAIDDFGTGFSSLSYLDSLEADRLKIDRTFITALHGDAASSHIAETVVNLSRRLGMTSVAEGVETAEQEQLLRSFGCDEVQGFLYAKPMPLPELLDWLSARAPRASSAINPGAAG